MRLLNRDRHRHDDTTDRDHPPDRDDPTLFDDHDSHDHLAVRPATTEPMGAHDDGARSTVDLRSETTQPVRIRERSWDFAPGQLISLVVGSMLVALGAVALIRAGLGEPLSTPVVEVLGWSHTAWLGLIEIGVGAALMLVGASTWGKWLSVLLGAAMVVAGVVVRAEPDGLPDELGVEPDFGWPLIALGALVALAAMILPVWRTSTTNTKVLDLTEGDRRADPDAEVNEELVVERRDAERSGRHFWSRS